MRPLIKRMLSVQIAFLLFIASQSFAVTETPATVEVFPAGGVAGDGFGSSTALSHDTLVVGVPGQGSTGEDLGVVYVYIRSGAASWQEQARIVAENGTPGDGFGASVAVSGDTIAIGAAGDDEKEQDSGAIYVYERQGNSWLFQAKLAADDGAVGDAFGYDVAIDGDLVVVGAPNGNNGTGAAYIFLRSAGSWEQQAKLLADGDKLTGDRFGCSVALGFQIFGDNFIIIGADGSDTSTTTDAGSAHVFKKYGSTWYHFQKLTASNAEAGDHFGWSVAAGFEKALIGVNRKQSDVSRPGAAYAFTGSLLSEQQIFHGDNDYRDDGFGFDVAIYDNFFVVGAPRETQGETVTGAVYVYARATDSPWPQHTKYAPQDGIGSDNFGASVSLYADTLITGVPGRGAGMVYAYMYPCSLGRPLLGFEWQMISRPCSNTSPAKALFGDDIADGIFNTTWTVYRTDYSKKVPYYNSYGYFKLGEAEAMNEGEGYWIYSTMNGILEVNGSRTPTIDSPECPSMNGCVEISLAWPNPGERYYNNQVGNPFAHAIDWSDARFVITPVDESAPLVLTPSEAYEMNFVRNSYYRYERIRWSAYNDVTPGMNGIIAPLESVWVHTLDPNEHAFPASVIKLLVPAAGPLKPAVQ